MSTRKSLFFSFLDRYASLAISVVASMVIARLLTPAEIGVFSVTMVLLMFVSTFRDLGAGQYLVQVKELTTESIRAVWAVQLGLGLGLACLVLLASYPVALFYKEPRMRDIMLVVALNYAINPFGSLTYAWLMREMRFESVAMMRFSAGLSGAMVTTWLAWKDFGAISLAFGSLASTVANALIAVYFRPKSFPWLPGLTEVKRVLTFGSKLTAASIVNVMAGGAPELLLGKLQSLTAAGLYSRSVGVVNMFHRLFADAVTVVALPLFAKQFRENQNLADPFLKATAYVTAFGWSFCLAVICLAHPIIRAMYGNQWDQSVDLARLPAVSMIFSASVSLCGTALLSSGAVNKITKITIFSALQSIAFVAVGAWYGLTALGCALIVSAAVSAVMWLRITIRHIGLPVRALLHTFLQSAGVALLAAIGPTLALWIYGPYPDFFVMPLVLGSTGGLVGFVMGIIFLQHPLQEEVTAIWSRVKRLKPRK